MYEENLLYDKNYTENNSVWTNSKKIILTIEKK